jgi:ATP-dependent DNA ligase
MAFPAFRHYARQVLSRPPVSAYPAGFIEPCLPTGARSAPSGPLWVHEIKFDGYRFICRREGERVRVFSRHGRDWTDRVPLIPLSSAPAPISSVAASLEP